MSKTPDPRRFSDCFGRFQMERRTNQCVISLGQDPAAQDRISRLLHSWGMDRFTLLAGARSNCQISLPLYAGDGMVVKVTPAGYDSDQEMPHQLPPCRRVVVQGKDDQYAVTLWPFLRPPNMGEYAVETMRNRLAELGLRFDNGDDRADNLGQLADGTLGVLDHGAVCRMPGQQPDRAPALDQWLTKLAQIYPRLYGPGPALTIAQGPDTDFRLKTPDWATKPPAPKPAPKRRGWWPF